MNNDNQVLVCNDVKREFLDGDRQIKVLNGINLTIQKGESVAIIGSSGSGKTTLLQILGGLDSPSTGTVHLVGNEIGQMSEKKRSDLRNQYLGFVYQFHHLLPEFTALENVAMPLLIRRTSNREAFGKAQELLERVGLAERLTHKPSALSGGERQRTAIARALVSKPALLLADEPTGNLDVDTESSIIQLLLELKDTIETSMVIVTHDMNVANKMDRVLKLDHGVLQAVA